MENEKKVSDDEKIRTFISIDVPEHIQEKIVNIQKQLPGFKGKTIKPENLHLTLKFLGEISPERVEEVREKLKEIPFEKFKGIETRTSKIGVFSEKYVRIVWLKLEGLDKLQETIDEKLSEIEGFEKEKRFMGHLTIARVRSLKNKNYFLGELDKVEVPENLKFKVERFRLKKSTLYPEGPVYEVLEDYSLA